jgi:hypothetical protein
MATQPVPTAERHAETREVLRLLRERNAESRERVLGRAANLGRIAEKLRAGRRR